MTSPLCWLYFFFPAAILCYAQPTKLSFQSDIQPIFQKNCISCHGPEQQSGGMRLDRRSSAMEGRGSVRLGPGNAAASMVYLRISGTKYANRCLSPVHSCPRRSTLSAPGLTREPNGLTRSLAISPRRPPIPAP